MNPSSMSPENEPLWLVMADAYAVATGSNMWRSWLIARGDAARIRALRDWLVPEVPEPNRGDYPNFTDFSCASAQWRDRQRLRALLTAEAELAEGGGQ